MRRRWHISEQFAMSALMVWLVAGGVVFLTVSAATGNLHDEPSTAAFLVLGGWYGPVVLAGGLYGLRWLAVAGWRHRPRRIWESLPDAREVHQREMTRR